MLEMGPLSTTTILTVLAVTIAVTQSAPLRKSRLPSSSIINPQRQKRSDAISQQETKLALVINNEADASQYNLKDSIISPHRQQRSPKADTAALSGRSKRHATHIDHAIHVDHSAVHGQRNSDTHLPRSRGKRSAAWFLSAAIRLCDNHPSLCRRIEVEERDVKMTIRIEEM